MVMLHTSYLDLVIVQSSLSSGRRTSFDFWNTNKFRKTILLHGKLVLLMLSGGLIRFTIVPGDHYWSHGNEARRIWAELIFEARNKDLSLKSIGACCSPLPRERKILLALSHLRNKVYFSCQNRLVIVAQKVRVPSENFGPTVSHALTREFSISSSALYLCSLFCLSVCLSDCLSVCLSLFFSLNVSINGTRNLYGDTSNKKNAYCSLSFKLFRSFHFYVHRSMKRKIGKFHRHR